jgi:hypothetical protein
VAFLSGAAVFVLRRSLVSRAGEPRIAATAASPFRNYEVLIGRGEVEQLIAGIRIVNDGSDRHGNLDRVTVVPRPVTALTVPASLSRVFGVKAKVQKSVVMLAGNKDYIASAAAVSTRRAAAWHIFLAAERQTTVPAIACFDSDTNIINKHAGKTSGRTEVRPPW